MLISLKLKKMKITAKHASDFYNAIFFDEEKNLVDAKVSIFLKQGDNELIIPNVQVSAKKPFHEIIMDFHKKLKEEGPIELDVATEEKQTEPALIDFQQIEYRNNIYFVEQVAPEKFRIFNEERTKEISQKSPTAKGILKSYRNSFEK